MWKENDTRFSNTLTNQNLKSVHFYLGSFNNLKENRVQLPLEIILLRQVQLSFEWNPMFVSEQIES